MSEYLEKFKDPRWQKKRLKILERDSFTCQACESTTDTLNVHHLLYNKGVEPWEYEDYNLITLCEYCHEIWTYIYKSEYAPEIISCVVRLYDKIERQGIYRVINKK